MDQVGQVGQGRVSSGLQDGGGFLFFFPEMLQQGKASFFTISKMRTRRR